MFSAHGKAGWLAFTAIAVACLTFFPGCLPSDPDTLGSGEEVKHPAGGPVPPPDELDARILQIRAFGEAPMLATRVTAGELPPVAERLPENPLVVKPLNSIGRYGGTLHRALTGDIIQVWGVKKTLNENLMGYERPMPKSIQNNLAGSHEFLDEGRTAIFHLRRGVKWSDGHPFTVEDILFWYYDVVMNDNGRETPVPPTGWKVEGEFIRMEALDDYTLKVTSHKPLGNILENFSSDDFALPKHKLSQFHPRYKPDAEYETFREKTTRAQTSMQPGIPRISAWAPVQWVRGQRIVYERNPYYWKVDTAGNQLPYADRLEFQVIENVQAIILKFINGELDLYGRYPQNDLYSMLKSREEEGKIRIRLAGPARGPALYLNWDTPNRALGKAFRNKQVRIALSHAINREEIGGIAYKGLLEPAGYSFNPESPYYSEEAHMRYSEYDPELANRMLENEGFRDTDGDGFRELEDGSRFELTIDIVSSGMIGANAVSACELVMDHWGAAGIKVNLNIALRDIIFPRRETGQYDVHFWVVTWYANSPEWAILNSNTPFWHREASTEGPEWLREATEMMNRAATTIDPDEKREAMERLRDLHSENVPVIGLGSLYNVWGSSTRLGNVPEEITPEDGFRGWSRPLFHEQIYIK